ncbi:MAG: ribosome biogenesis GTPase Der [Bacillota bacterium]|nr:ribosome biogenesis GTPase Der [Bacillota bacterium]MDW7676464.1 ribosome biogenesis GTPase Der [Bacillota bacterium]
MAKPVVAVIGRPNVGKSTFFNRLAGKRISIVENTPGVTRDRIYSEVEWLNHRFSLIDTGGLEPSSSELIPSKMRQQAQLAIDMADVILFIVDGRTGVTAQDREISELLRKNQKPILLVVNKVDSHEQSEHYYDFYELGLGEPIEISSEMAYGIGDLLDSIVAFFPDESVADPEEDLIKVAVIGKPNVGKSSLINHILGEERVIVSELAGTTRDAIDTRFTAASQDYLLIDTAGLRRKSRIHDDVEHYSVIRAIAAIERSDVCVLMIDGQEGVTEQDKKVAGLSHENGKAMLILVNKWDLVEKDDKTVNRMTKDIRRELGFCQYAPILFVSVLSGQRINRILPVIQHIANQNALRIQTGVLNEVIAEATLMKQPPSDKGKRLKIYYATQVSVKPPTFVLFINDKELTHFSYLRYLENRIRESFGFEGTPLRFMYREKAGGI